MSSFRVPGATYRIQFNLNFRFADAKELVPYLHNLGITDVYASPRSRARRGSSHGYDVADPQRVNSELGTEQEFRELVEKLRQYGMGLLLDIVPNHMAASSENPWWTDVLENGPSSRFAHYFDIDWRPAGTKAAFLQENRVLLPVLGDLYGNVLENQELAVKLDENGFFVRYYEQRFPLEPKSCVFVLQAVDAFFKQAGSLPQEASREIASLIEALHELPDFTSTGPGATAKRADVSAGAKARIWHLYHSDAGIRRSFEEALARFSGDKSDPGSFDVLDRLLEAQPYRLAHWKIGLEEINYRRFFDINDLVRLRVEVPDVFEDRHRVILQLVKDGLVHGLRIDHIDGLYDPLGYLRKLQDSSGEALGKTEKQNLFVVVEKILGEGESLPAQWPVCGTTGYDFLNAVAALFMRPDGLEKLEAAYARITLSNTAFSEVSYQGNQKAMQLLFGGEVQALSQHLAKLAARDRRARDLPLQELMQLLIEVTACLPVYRTYLNGPEVSPRDRPYLTKALALARKRVHHGKVSDAALAFLRQVCLLEPPAYSPEAKEDYLRFMMRWQQFTGPVMAKGVEDTAFYVHNSLISRNEVGGDPLRENPPTGIEGFHAFQQARCNDWPRTLNATATHDTKRGEDTRTRISVLSEMTEQWEACLPRWRRWNKPCISIVRGHPSPAPSEEILLYQTMLGAWPFDEGAVCDFGERLKAYAIKAAREAKQFTSWIEQDAEHEAALTRFVDAILAPGHNNRFLNDFLRLQKKMAFYGALNSLAQVVLKITSPGIPDFYQGAELWDLSLVDPDNRRPVDFATRARHLEELHTAERSGPVNLVRELLSHWQDGRIKLFATCKALEARNAFAEVFQGGEYLPLTATGKFKNHVCGYARRHRGRAVLTIAQLLPAGIVASGKFPTGQRVWGDERLPIPTGLPSQWKNAFTSERLTTETSGGSGHLMLRDVFHVMPVAILTSVE